MDRYEEATRIEATVDLPDGMLDSVMPYIEAQDAARGAWPSPRDSAQPHAPWPTPENPMFQFLVKKAQLTAAGGADLDLVIMQIAIHAWFEGGIENYDRGQAHGRRPRLER